MVVASLVIRKMMRADRVMIGEIGFRAWVSSDASADVDFDPSVIARTRRAFETFASGTRADVWVAQDGADVIGWGACDGAPNYISDLWVDPDHQRKGVGRCLLLHICGHLHAQGHQTAVIHTQARNSGAINLYERCGFTIVWRGIEHSPSMGVDLDKVHLEKDLK